MIKTCEKLETADPESDVDETAPQLVPLRIALRPYRGVSVRVGRHLIHVGKLAATKVGREYLVSPADVAELLRPRIVTRAPKEPRETRAQREERQLRAAGMAPATT